MSMQSLKKISQKLLKLESGNEALMDGHSDILCLWATPMLNFHKDLGAIFNILGARYINAKYNTNSNIYRYCSKFWITPNNNSNCYYWYCILRWLTWQLYLAIHSVSSKYM